MPPHMKATGVPSDSRGGPPDGDLLACFAPSLDQRRLGHSTLGRKANSEVTTAVDRRTLCDTLTSLAAPSAAPPGCPRVAPSYRVVIVPTLGPTGGMRDPVFILDFCGAFCAPSFGGGCGGVTTSGAAVLYRLVPAVGTGAAQRRNLPQGAPAPAQGGIADAGWHIDTVWVGRDGGGFGTGIAMDREARSQDLRSSALWANVVRMLRDEPIGLPRTASVRGGQQAMCECCWVDIRAAGEGKPGAEQTWEELGRPRPEQQRRTRQ